MIPDCYKISSIASADVEMINLPAAAGSSITVDGAKVVGQLYSTYYKVTHYYDTTEYSFVDTRTGCHFYRDGSTYYYMDTAYKVSEDRFTQLEISEISGTNNYSTNNLTSKTFGILYLDKKYYDNGYVYVSTQYSNILYKFSNLKNFHSLTFKFYDSFGVQLNSSINQDDGTDTTKPLADITDAITTDYHPAHYLLHPLFKYRQIHMVFKAGVLDVELNKKNIV